MDKDEEIKLETLDDVLKARAKLEELEKRLYSAVKRWIKRLEKQS